MYIKKIQIKNFRKFDEIGIEIEFDSGINIILGENNTGKSALIDAMRLALSSGKYRKNIYATIDDFYIDQCGVRSDIINIDICFSDLTEEQGSAFYMLTDGTDTTKAEMHIEYHLTKDAKGNDKVRDIVTGGPSNNPLDKETFDNINMIFLPALRNAENDLRPSRNGQLANMFMTIASTDEDKKRVLSNYLEAANTLNTDPAIEALKDIINRNLKQIEKEELQQNIDINLIEPTFEGISASLDASYMVEHPCIEIESRELEAILTEINLVPEVFKETDIIKKSKEKKLFVDLIELKRHTCFNELYSKLSTKKSISRVTLRQNGLGYNNILSMSASLGDLQKKPSQEEISILLVEEPEAHLHPQLLELLFNFFRTSIDETPIQLILTSHSPTLVSKADLNSIHLLYNYGKRVVNTSIKKIGLSQTQLSDLKRYIDVTKSQLFFAKRTIFVEGISEAILINEFAKLLKKPLDKYSVEIVNIEGVDFEPFAKLFAKNDDGTHIHCPCAIISDDDRCTNNDDKYQILKSELVCSNANVNEIVKKLKHGEISHRANNLLEFHKENVCVELAEKTLEYELAKITENHDVLLDIISEFHPTIYKSIKTNIEKGEEPDMTMIRIWLAISDIKGKFAQKLAAYVNKIANGESNKKFVVPSYIKKAICHVIDGDI